MAEVLFVAGLLFGVILYLEYFDPKRAPKPKRTSLLSDADEGTFVKLHAVGVLTETTTHTAPFSKRDCIWFKVSIFKTALKEPALWEEPVYERTHGNILTLSDGKNLILVENPKMEAVIKTRMWQKKINLFTATEPHLPLFLKRLHLPATSGITGSDYFFSEQIIDKGMPLTVTGKVYKAAVVDFPSIETKGKNCYILKGFSDKLNQPTVLEGFV
ncbi:MAG: hypothetical protein QM534_05605 [Sediminibacterium sp.]|nr:hypothetical protein [Sediminibacterium sp.]